MYFDLGAPTCSAAGRPLAKYMRAERPPMLLLRNSGRCSETPGSAAILI